MSDVFFEELEIPKPDIHLGVGSGSHAAQTARIMEAFEAVLLGHRPDWVVVVGDVNSTLACSVVAAKMSPPIRVAHVEAGLRSRDRAMPEEINRIVTDALADLLFTTEAGADRNLRAEGVDRRKIRRVGNVMIDTLLRFVHRSDASDVLVRLRIGRPYALLTLHRPSNVDDERPLRRIVAALDTLGREIAIVFPAHPRTVKMMEAFGLRPGDGQGSGPGLRIVEPLGYLDFLHLQKRAAVVLTDSGGIQEEAPSLGVPVLVARETTERPEGIAWGGNRLVGTTREAIGRELRSVLERPRAARPAPPLPNPFGDGRAGARIHDAVLHFLGQGGRPEEFRGPDPPASATSARDHRDAAANRGAP